MRSILRSFPFAAVALLGSFTLGSSELSAMQNPGEDMFSVSVQAGGAFPAEDMVADGYLLDFDDAFTIGGTATYWFHRNVGIRGNVLWAEAETITNNGDAPLRGDEPTILRYSGDIIFRLPQQASAFDWYPYLVGGLGVTDYDFDTVGSETNFTGNVGLGFEVRLADGRWGINLEGRDYISSFDGAFDSATGTANFDETLHDIVLTGGISINF